MVVLSIFLFGTFLLAIEYYAKLRGDDDFRKRGKYELCDGRRVKLLSITKMIS